VIKRIKQWWVRRQLMKLLDQMIKTFESQGLSTTDATQSVCDVLNATLGGMDREFVAALAKARVVERRGSLKN
jgi:hypothetical protein